MNQQDARLWARDVIVEAENELMTASGAGVFGRFQCEAAIQSVRVQRPVSGRTKDAALATMYQLLASRYPNSGSSEVCGYQPYWVTLANARLAMGQSKLADDAIQTSIRLSEDPAVRAFLAKSFARATSSASVIVPTTPKPLKFHP